ncbi:PspA/IM30 family protein [Candidatus Poribacteria bacterium]|nr:PspA/IM30 family protein [Candidatus Poribacteria bacterium]
MGVFSRIKTVFKSEVNSALDKVEDTEKMLNQTVVDMQQQLVKAKQQVAVAIADEKRLERQYNENQSQAESWMEKAKLAVQKGNDELAKAALERKTEYENLTNEFKAQWEAQKASVEKLKASLRELERKIDEARRQKDLLVARNKRAKAQKQIHQTMSNMNTNVGAFDTFDRMKRKVDEEEAKAAAAEEMASETGDTSLDKQFAELEKSSVDDELAALKSQMSGGDTKETTEVDSELSALKDEVKKDEKPS